MDLPNNTIWHLIQSGFAIKIAEKLLIFDYPLSASQTRKNDGLCTGFINPLEIRDENVIVFVSHGHEDHFHRDVFNWKNEVDQMQFVISSDIDSAPDEAIIAHPGESLTIDNIRIKCYVSTDLGVAYSVYLDHKHIYFSGDNGFWNWDGTLDDTVYIDQAIKQVDTSQPIDIAFQLCDPRLADMGAGGIYIFARIFEPELLVPIHSFGKYGFNKLAERELVNQGFRNKFWCISNRGDTLNF